MKPTHRLRVLDKETNQKGTAGAGWLNKDGSISIVLDPCVVLSGDRKNIVITLFPDNNAPSTTN